MDWRLYTFKGYICMSESRFKTPFIFSHWGFSTISHWRRSWVWYSDESNVQYCARIFQSFSARGMSPFYGFASVCVVASRSLPRTALQDATTPRRRSSLADAIRVVVWPAKELGKMRPRLAGDALRRLMSFACFLLWLFFFQINACISALRNTQGLDSFEGHAVDIFYYLRLRYGFQIDSGSTSVKHSNKAKPQITSYW